MEKRYLSLFEAENIIPRIRGSILKIKDISKAINLLETIDISTEDIFTSMINEIRINKSFHKLNLLLFKELESIAHNGAIIKDLEEGIVDFYSLFEGREIFLCWKLDEKDIKYWHETMAGFESRKPIALLRKSTRS